MDLGLRDRVAVVCASSKGLGRAVAECLAREGCKVSLCARSEEPVIKAAAEIRAATGSETLGVVADLTNDDQVRAFIDCVIRRWGSIDILVNNAGGPPAGPFECHSLEAWQKALDLNLLSTVRMCSLAIPFMKKQRWGRIVNITSVAARQPIDGLILSNSARAGVLGLSKSLANELGPWNILVNSVCPGYTLTDRLAELARAQAGHQGRQVEDIYHGWESLTPLGRLGTPDEFAAVVAFLASERASYLTGTAISIDGGLVRGPF